jgi:hypothetical protein
MLCPAVRYERRSTNNKEPRTKNEELSMPKLRNLVSAFLGLALAPLAAPLQAGVILIPITEVVAADPGNTTIRQLAAGRYQLTTRGLKLEGASCDEENCSAVDFAQDLRIVIDFTSAGISGQSRGDIVLPDTTVTFFQGPVDGKVRCIAPGPRPCATLELLVRTQARVEEEDGALAGIMDLEWIGTIQPQLGTWEEITGLGEIVLFDTDFSMDGHAW